MVAFWRRGPQDAFGSLGLEPPQIFGVGAEMWRPRSQLASFQLPCPGPLGSRFSGRPDIFGVCPVPLFSAGASRGGGSCSAHGA